MRRALVRASSEAPVDFSVEVSVDVPVGVPVGRAFRIILGLIAVFIVPLLRKSAMERTEDDVEQIQK